MELFYWLMLKKYEIQNMSITSSLVIANTDKLILGSEKGEIKIHNLNNGIVAATLKVISMKLCVYYWFKITMS